MFELITTSSSIHGKIHHSQLFGLSHVVHVLVDSIVAASTFNKKDQNQIKNIVIFNMILV